MGRWLNRIQADEKNTGTVVWRTDRTDGTLDDKVLSVSSAPQKRAPSFLVSAADQRTADDDALEERAAILEYDEGLPRAEAERLAADQMATILQFRRGA